MTAHFAFLSDDDDECALHKRVSDSSHIFAGSLWTGWIVGVVLAIFTGCDHRPPDGFRGEQRDDIGQPRKELVLRGAGGEVSFSPDGKRLITIGDASNRVAVWDAVRGERLSCFSIHQMGIECLAYHRDGKMAASGSGGHIDNEALEKNCYIWDINTGKVLLTLPAHQDGVNCLCFSPDGKQLATTCDLATRLWDVKTGKLLRTIKGKPRSCSIAVAYSPDGKKLATSASSTIYVWDVVSGKKLSTMQGQDNCHSVHFSPDGKWLASAGGGLGDSEVSVWDVESGKQVCALKGHTHGIAKVAFHPLGYYIASAGDDGTVRIWDWRAKKAVYVLQHSGAATALDFTRDGTRLAVADIGSESVVIWNLQAGAK